MYRIGHGQGQQPVGRAIEGGEGAQLLLHAAQRLVVLVGGIGTPYVDNGIVGGEPGQGVDVAVGVVAGQITVVEPQDALQSEGLFQILFDAHLRPLAVAVGREQAFACGEQGAGAVAFECAPLDYEVEPVFIPGPEPVLPVERRGDEVVVVGGKLESPPVELEVVDAGLAVAQEGDATVVASPRVVGGALGEGHRIGVDHPLQQLLYLLGVRRDNQQMLAFGNLTGEVDVAGRHFVEHVGPVGRFVGPGELDTRLRVPLGREEYRGVHAFGVCCLRSK